MPMNLCKFRVEKYNRGCNHPRLHLLQADIAALCVTALQWLIATRFRSFAVAVSVGIGGTFVAVAATSSKWGLYFPWLMPVNILASEPERADLAMAYGLTGGILIYGLGILWLARRDWG